MADASTNAAIGNTRNYRINRSGRFFVTIPIGDLIEHPLQVTEAELLQLPKATITSDQAGQCTVCFDEFELNEDDVCKLPCNHIYHKRCIFPWLLTNPTCPACRRPLRSAAANECSLDEVIRQHFSRFAIDFVRILAESRTRLPPAVVRSVPRRAAAVRASRAIHQLYGRNASRRHISDETEATSANRRH